MIGVYEENELWKTSSLDTCGQFQNLQMKTLVAHNYLFPFKWDMKNVDIESDFIGLEFYTRYATHKTS
jgi:hypothetical protein